MANEQTIANLIIKLSAQTVELAGGLKKAEGMLSSFKDTAQKILGAVSASLIAKQFISAITGAREFAAEMSRTAEKVGVPVEQISALADAADKSGVSTESMGIGLKFLSRNLFEASRGGGDLRGIMEEMNISFESSPGVIRPTMDVLLDLSERFKGMEEGAGKTAIALKFFGRSGQEMVPFMNQGSASIKEFMDDARRFGTVIDTDTGKKARALGIVFKEISDAIKGLSIGIMSALLPSMQSGADSTLSLAARINSLRLRLSEIAEVIRYVGAVALPLLAVKIAAGIVSITGLGWAVQNVGFIIQYFATVTLGPMLLNPLTWIAAALVGLSILWVKLGEGAREAAKDHASYVAAVSSMKPEDLQKNLVAMTDYLAMIQQKIAEAKEKIGEATPSLAQGMALDELQKFEAEAKARIAAIQKLQEATAKPAKVAAPIITDPEALKKLQDKAAQLGAEFAAFQDPVKGASAAIEEFIRQTIGTVVPTDKLKKAANDVRAAFQTLFAAQQARANLAAAEKGTFAVSVAGWEAYGQDLQRQFDNGLIDIRSFFRERRSLIEAQTAAEILLLQAERGRKETTPARRIEIDAEIKVKGIKQDASIKADLAAETAAWRTLGETSLDFEQRLAEAQGRVLEGKRAALALEMQTFEVGLRGRGVSAEQAKKQTDDLFVAKTKEIDFNEQIRQFSLEIADLDIRKQKVKDDLAVGVGNQATAEEAILALERDRIPVLKAMADEAMRLAMASKDPALLQQAQALDAAVRQLSISTNKSGQDLATLKKGAQDALVDGFANFLSRGIREAKNFGEAVKGMAAAFAQAMADMIAQMLAMMAVKAMLSFAGFSGGGEVATSGTAGSVGSGVVKAAGGGTVRGPGTETSDSILALLSKNEYVVRAKAVRHYGVSVLEAINRMVLPKEDFAGVRFMSPHSPGFAFATGGLAQGGGGGTTTLDSSLTVGLDQGLILKALDTSAGQRVLVKILEKNKRSVRSAIGG